IAAALAGEERVHGMVEIVGPLGIKAMPALVRTQKDFGIVQVALGDYVNMSRRTCCNLVSDLLDGRHDMEGTEIKNRMDGVKPQAIEVKVLQPHAGVIEHVVPNGIRAGPVVVERLSPRCLVAVREVWSKLAEIVPLRPEVVVHHIE